MGLPPVIVGLVVALLLFRGAPLGGLNLLYTLNGVILAQAVLAFPIVAALTAVRRPVAARGPARPGARVRRLPRRRSPCSPCARRASACSRPRSPRSGSAFAEVGAVVLVGGNIEGQTQTLASAVLVRVSAGEYGTAIALGILLLGLVLMLAAALTALQQRQAENGARPPVVSEPLLVSARPRRRARRNAPSCTTSTSRCAAATCSRCSGPTAPASRRCSPRSPA